MLFDKIGRLLVPEVYTPMKRAFHKQHSAQGLYLLGLARAGVRRATQDRGVTSLAYER